MFAISLRTRDPIHTEISNPRNPILLCKLLHVYNIDFEEITGNSDYLDLLGMAR